MQQGNTPTTAGWWNPGDGIRRPGRERQDTSVRVLHDVFEQISHPAYIAERKRVATQGVNGIPDRDRSQRGLERMCSLLITSRRCKTELCRHCTCKPSIPSPKRLPTQTRMGLGRNEVVPMQWHNAPRCS